MKKNILSITIFQGWIRVLKIDKSGKENTWSTQNKVCNIDEIRDTLKEAVNSTGSKGCFANIILDHDQLRHKAIDIPPMNSKDTHDYIARKVDQIKEFDGEAAFSYKKTSRKNKEHVSINFIPLSFIDDLKKACADAGVFLMLVIPFLRVREQQFRELSIGKDEVAAIVVSMYDKVSLLIGKNDGAIFSDRHLKVNLYNPDDVERVSKEVQRSILYNKQQFGERVVQVVLSEHFEKNVYQCFTKNLDIPIGWLPPKPSRFYWNHELLNISFNDEGNLLIRKYRDEIVIKRFTKAALVLAVILWSISFFTLVTIEYLLYKERKLLADIMPQAIELRNTRDKLLDRKAKINRFRHVVKKLEEERTPPVPGWFLGYLCNEVPDELILTSTQILRKDSVWEVVIDGFSNEGNRVMMNNLKEFCDNLQNGPFKMSDNKNWYKEWLKLLKIGSVSDSGVSRFSIDGVIR
ncbi:transcriptional regulator [Candidatus Scalindua japonica]|uniref:Transcriptional regulator n=1 Tax=Candidatus Scalindua japonica TaxID=1284222 RepID=A0A286U3N7_9BACT|nr:hypothetical protein [Candidatus Scalindua japonica]GAX62691.1 transcriptional regulator [Candidatus Scalindua japonica]